MIEAFNPLPLIFVARAPVNEGLARSAMLNPKHWRSCALEFFTQSDLVLDFTFDEFWQHVRAQMLDTFTRAALSELVCYSTSNN